MWQSFLAFFCAASFNFLSLVWRGYSGRDVMWKWKWMEGTGQSEPWPLLVLVWNPFWLKKITSLTNETWRMTRLYTLYCDDKLTDPIKTTCSIFLFPYSVWKDSKGTRREFVSWIRKDRYLLPFVDWHEMNVYYVLSKLLQIMKLGLGSDLISKYFSQMSETKKKWSCAIRNYHAQPVCSVISAWQQELIIYMHSYMYKGKIFSWHDMTLFHI